MEGWSTQPMSAARKGRNRITSLLKRHLLGLQRGKPGAKNPEALFARAMVVLGLVGLIAISDPVAAKTPRHVRKFDIICSVSGYWYKAFHPELEGYGSMIPESWAFDFRYRIDLNAGEYTDIGPKDEKTMKIASTSSRIITFSRTTFEHVTFNLKTRRFLATSKMGPYSDGFAAGPCRFARYSGSDQGPLSRRARHPG